MKQPYAHDAVLTMAADHDEGAPGAAITTALCGHWQHEPPCPLAPHHTGAARDGDRLRLRILFAAAEADEPEARRRIEEALAAGAFGSARWRVLETAAAEITPDEREHARRLARRPGPDGR
jgi:hypothetical protein